MSDFFLSEDEFVNGFNLNESYLETVVATDTLLVATTTHAPSGIVQEKGHEKVHVDSDGAPRTITLPSAANLNRYRPMIVNVGANIVTITPDGTETIDGVAGSQTITAQFSAMILSPNKDGNGWLALRRVTP